MKIRTWKSIYVFTVIVHLKFIALFSVPLHMLPGLAVFFQLSVCWAECVSWTWLTGFVFIFAAVRLWMSSGTSCPPVTFCYQCTAGLPWPECTHHTLHYWGRVWMQMTMFPVLYLLRSGWDFLIPDSWPLLFCLLFPFNPQSAIWGQWLSQWVWGLFMFVQ